MESSNASMKKWVREPSPDPASVAENGGFIFSSGGSIFPPGASIEVPEGFLLTKNGIVVISQKDVFDLSDVS